MKKILGFIYLGITILSYGDEIEFEIVEKSNNKIKILAKLDIENSKGTVSRLEEREYDVLDGDTLSELAYDRELNLEKMTILNELNNPNLITIGQKLMIPKSDNYVLEKLEFEGSIDEVALREKISIDDLKMLNTEEEIQSGKIRIIRYGSSKEN